MPTFCQTLLLSLLVLTLSSSRITAADRVDFETEVLPLLQAHCFRCHGSQKQEGGLRLDRREALLAGGDSGPALDLEDPADSLILIRIQSADETIRMPQQSRKLLKHELEILQRWISDGGNGLRDVDDRVDHWAFQPIRSPRPPDTGDSSWPENAIDSFVWQQLRLHDLQPAPAADKHVLVRRLFLDLLGIPPTPDQLQLFLTDSSPDAYTRLVDSVLASPQFGERWGRHWLDLARYADSAGYEADVPRTIWRFRDWVIGSLNQDKPLDQFVIEQLGGDLLPAASIDAQLATGFHCNAMKDNGVRHESVFDRVNTTGAVFLGLTLECGQCHDHKTDPLTQREYYQLYAFFNSSQITPLDLSSDDIKQQRAVLQTQIAEIDKQLAETVKKIEQNLDQQIADRSLLREGLTDAILALFEIPADKRSKSDLTQLLTFFRLEDNRHKQLSESRDKLLEALPAADTSLALVESPQPTHLFIRGDHTQPGDLVEASTPAFLPPLEWDRAKRPQPNRADFGRWLVDHKNPLFARVTANRFWMRLFGAAIVEPENDFGIQTPRPRHYQLLNFLAAELQQTNSIKSFVRLLVTSASYRQSSQLQNRGGVPAGLFAGQQRLRLEAELLRDNALASSGLLVNQIGGPSVFPYQPEGILNFRATPASWTESTGANRYRRGMYTHIWRLTPHPMYTLFDGPELTTTCTRRTRSNVAVQALGLLNDPSFVECAQALAARLLVEAAGNEQRLDRLFVLCLGRQPTAEERELVMQLFIEQLQIFIADKQLAIAAVGDHTLANADLSTQAAWAAVSRAIMNLDEFVTRE
jgi:hypothetical protein